MEIRTGIGTGGQIGIERETEIEMVEKERKTKMGTGMGIEIERKRKTEGLIIRETERKTRRGDEPIKMLMIVTEIKIETETGKQ